MKLYGTIKKKAYLFCTVVSIVGNTVLITLHINKKHIHIEYSYISFMSNLIYNDTLFSTLLIIYNINAWLPPAQLSQQQGSNFKSGTF